MFIINKETNRISKIEKKSFKELGFGERTHLQEWLANNPEALGEEILIIQKEFDGFNDTNERLDLLGLDKQGNLIVIENKLDDTGKDVTWQVLKYASYCSTLKKEQIRKIYQEYLDKYYKGEKAENKLIDFYDANDFAEISLNTGQTQRIIMVAGNYRKEVTSTVLWLLNYKLRIQCFKTTPYKLENQLFLDFEQIIPIKDAEEFSISMAEKTQEDITSQEELKARHYLRRDFWLKLIKNMNENSKLFKNISPSISNWIGAGSGISGIGYNFAISKKYARCEIYIDRGDFEINKQIFDYLYSKKEEIEKDFGDLLEWERLDDKRASRIKYENPEYDVFDREQWEEMIDFMTDGMIRLEKSFKDKLKDLHKKIIDL